MFEGLRSEIEGLVVPAHGDAIIDARRLLDALTARVAEAESGYAAAGGWDVDGFGSMAAFLRHRSKDRKSVV